MNTTIKAAAWTTLVTALGLSQAAHAAVGVATDYGACNVDINYGSTGAANVGGFFAGEFGVYSAADIGNVSGLDFSCRISGSGTGLMTIDYVVENNSADASYNMDFLALADPNGDGLFANDMPMVDFPATTAAAEPDAWATDDYFGNLQQKVSVQGQLDNTDNCGASCDLIYALQWDLGTVDPGTIMMISVGLSDDGQWLSSRHLTAALDDGSGTAIDPQLTFSGMVSEVPVPGAAWLFASALAGLGGIARRRA